MLCDTWQHSFRTRTYVQMHVVIEDPGILLLSMPAPLTDSVPIVNRCSLMHWCNSASASSSSSSSCKIRPTRINSRVGFFLSRVLSQLLLLDYPPFIIIIFLSYPVDRVRHLKWVLPPRTFELPNTCNLSFIIRK